MQASFVLIGSADLAATISPLVAEVIHVKQVEEARESMAKTLIAAIIVEQLDDARRMKELNITLPVIWLRASSTAMPEQDQLQSVETVIARDDVAIAAPYLASLAREAILRDRLLQQEERLEALFTYGSDLVFTLDREGKIHITSPSFLRLLGYESSEVEGQDVTRFIHPDDVTMIVKRLEDLYGDAVARGTVEVRVEHKNGSWRSFEAYAKHFDEEGLVVTAWDITQHKKLEEQLEQAKAEAILANVTKDQFLSNMSHELRTPLTSLLGFSELLQQGIYGELSPSQQQPLDEIARSGQQLLDLINSILELSRLEKQTSQLRLEMVRVPETLERVLADVEALARQNRNEISLQIEDDVDVIFADFVGFQQIVKSLISNAVKFTHRGKIDIHVEVRHEGEKMLYLTVTDTGIGIAPGEMSKLFEPFTQVDGSSMRRYGGAGLGLTLCRYYCRLMKGDVRVRSQLGEGSEFVAYVACDNVPDIEGL